MIRSPLTIFKDKRYTALSAITAFILLATVCQSRSFVLGYSFSLLFFTLDSFRVLHEKKYLFSLIFISVIFSYLIIFFIKTDSSLGRLLIYKISLGMLNQNYITGIGLGNFAVAYGNSQISYFERGNYSTKELLLADNTTHAFNDYLQFVIETGVTGSIVLLVLALLIYKICKKGLMLNKKRPLLLSMAVSQITAIAFAAFFTHIFEKTLWQCVLLLSIGTVVYYNYWISPGNLAGITFLLLSMSLAYKYGRYVRYANQYEIMSQAMELLRCGYVKESVKRYTSLYPQLQEDNTYLSDYAGSLMVARKYQKAEQILSTLIRNENNSANYDMLAECYQRNGKLKEAELTYLKAINRVPNRFTSRFNLYNFYRSIGNRSQAELIGRQILLLPVKVESAMVGEIKKTVRNNL